MTHLLSSVPPLIFFSNGTPWYLKYTLSQARRFNQSSPILLFTDALDETIDDTIQQILISDYDEDYERFLLVYKHLSTNSFSFEAICFGRWFIINRFLKDHFIPSFWYFDSDVLIFTDLTKENDILLNYDISLSQRSCSHCSFWKDKKTLQDFCDFIMEQYSTSLYVQKLEDFYQYHRKESRPGGVSDMALINLFVDQSSLQVFDSSLVHDNAVFDHNLSSVINNPHEKGYQSAWGIKKIYWRDELPFIERVSDRERIRLSVIHCQGKSKQFISTIYKKKKINFISYFFALFCRFKQAELLTKIHRFRNKALKITKEILKYILNILSLKLVALISLTKNNSIPREGVCIVRADNLGDLIIFLPILKQLSDYYTNQKITLIVSEAAAEFAQGLVTRHFFSGEIVVVNRKKFNNNILYKIKFLVGIHNRNFLTALSPVFSRESIGDTIILSTNASSRIGWQGDDSNCPHQVQEKYNRFFTRLIFSSRLIEKEIEKNIFFYKEVTGKINSETINPDINLTPVDYEQVDELLQFNNLVPGKFIVLAPGAGAQYRIWSADRFARIGNFISLQGYKVVICGTKNEAGFAKEISKYSKSPIVDLTGQTPIFILGALLKKTRLCLGSEAAIIHLAAIQSIPTLCIMGGGHFRRFFPHYNIPVQNIIFQPIAHCFNDNWECGQGKEIAPCIQGISVKRVEKKIEKMLALI